MGSTVKLTGVAEMKTQLKQLTERMRQGVYARGIYEGAKTIQNAVIARAPVRTGNLKKNIIVYKDRKPENATVHYSVLVRRIKVARKVKRLIRQAAKQGVEINFSDSAFYWRFLEFGTSKMRARPFFRPAIEAVKGALVSIVGGKLQSGIDRAVKQVGGK